jgi:hypothetical protein
LSYSLLNFFKVIVIKTRDFLAAFPLGALAVAALGKASGLMNKAMANAAVMVKVGTCNLTAVKAVLALSIKAAGYCNIWVIRA